MKQSIPSPPKWADYLLSWFCAEELLEEIQGDLHEAYYYRYQNRGPFIAKILFVVNVIQFFRPYTFEKYSRVKQFLPMFKNYAKIAIRNILHRKGFTLINTMGLALGISTVMLIGFYLKHEFTYDHSIPKHEHVYRLMNDYRVQTYCPMFFKDYYSSSPDVQLRLVNYLKEQDDIEVACHFVPSQSAIGGGDQYYVQFGQQTYIGEHVLYTNTGASFQQIFPQDFLMGSPESAFSAFNKIILTERLALKWFGASWEKMDLIGKTLIIREENYELAGIIANPKDNIHFDFDWIVHQESIPSWGAYTYFRKSAESSVDQIMERLNQEVDKIYPSYKEDELKKGISAIALADIHYRQGTLYELKPIANKSYLITFLGIGCLILLVIWANYTNLSMAMYSDRQLELGIRKVMGAQARDISAQLFAESIIMALICYPICLSILYLTLPLFNDLMGVYIPVENIFSFLSLTFLFVLLICSALISVAYPAFVYAWKPMLALFNKKLKISITNRYFNFRNILLTLQFIMVVALLSITIFIYQQMSYVAQKDLGYQREDIIFFDLNGNEKYQQLKTELLKLPEVESIGANGIPGAEMYNQLTYKLKDSEEVFADGTQLYWDKDAFTTLNLACESCDALNNNKASAFVINQTAAEKLAKVKNISPEELIGETIIMEPEWENEEFGFGYPMVIDGIIDNFDYFTLKYNSQPLLIEVHQNPEWVYTMTVRANSSNWKSTIQSIKDAYTAVEPVVPFDFYFLDDHLDQLYKEDQRSATLLAALSILIVLLALIGLGGVVSYIAYARQKEVSIRKILGATIWNIWLSFNKEFLLLLSLATIIALPMSLYMSNIWLENFAYGIKPQWWMVPLIGISVGLLVTTIISLRIRHTANAHPIKALRLKP